MKKLYSYQKRVHSLVLRAINTIGKALMVMAPGLGKTVVASFLLQSLYKKRNRVLFLCHDNYILAQAHREFRESFDPDENLKFYDFFGSEKCVEEARKAHIVFASFQSLNSTSKWYRRFSKNHFDIIIVDEGHHAQAPTFREVIKYFNPSKTLCMTGTPDRMDELDIRDLYGEEVVNITIEEGIAKGWLTNVEYHLLSDGLNKDALKELFKEVVTEKRRISLNQINKQLFVKKRDQEQIKEIKKHTNNWSKKCIIFCSSIHHVRSFAKNLEKGTYCTFHSENSTKTNNENLHIFKHGDMNIILSVDKFNEGIDIPDVEVIVFIRATESGIIYRQQLGRGLRKKLGKSKVVVLDFVANTQRILMVQGMVKSIQRYTDPVRTDKSLLSVSGTHYSFNFSDELEDIMEILRVARMGFYETWQEASQAAVDLGIKQMREYFARHKEDRRLPSHPHNNYADFPGYDAFLGRTKKNFYATWNEASASARKLGLTGYRDYQKRYTLDPRLPSFPYKTYPDFPGWPVFFGADPKNFYPTWKDASVAAKKIGGITSDRAYYKKYKTDKRLPSDPSGYYEDFPGWAIFNGTQDRFDKYKTWQEASKASIKLGLKNMKDYQKRYKLDSKLYRDPYTSYHPNFPGWKKFLGTG
ncbi:MAG: DEAD/DEAH box helicase family protein [bacterium]